MKKRKKMSEETKRKIGLANSIGLKGNHPRTEFKKGRKYTEEEKKKLMGHTPWNKGKTGVYSKDSIVKMSKSHKGYIPWMKGKHHSEETKLKMSEKKKGKSSPKKGIFNSEETRKKISLALKGRKPTAEDIKKRLRRNPKSSLEIKMENIINKLELPYKFVGNGKVIVGKKCPDFVHLTEKIAVEVFYRKHKEMFRENGLQGWKEERTEIFNKEGWRIIFFDETQVNEENVLNILGEKN
jgi:very-short-patch-repair endonuclease